MSDYNPENIPVLDDVIECGDEEKRDFDLSVGGAKPLDADPDAELYATENNMDLFASEDIDLAAEDSDIDPAVFKVEAATVTVPVFEQTISTTAEPQIGAIDNISNEDDYAQSQTVAEQNMSPWMDDSRSLQITIAEQEPNGVPGSSEAVRQDDVSGYNPAKSSEDEAEMFESALIDFHEVDETESLAINMQAINKQVEVKQQNIAANTLQSVTDDIIKQLMPELEQQLRLLLSDALKEKLSEDITRDEVSPSSKSDNI
jgi:hypothetical protein